MTALMVTTKKEKGVGVPHFESPEVQHTLRRRRKHDTGDVTLIAHLNAEVSSIDIVTQKEIVRSWRETAHLEQSNKIRVLTMHVPDNLNRC